MRPFRNTSFRHPALWAVILSTVCLLDCDSTRRDEGSAAPDRASADEAPTYPSDLETPAFLDNYRPLYRQSLERAVDWLDELEVDPEELHEQGLKSKKKYVEILDAYIRLHRVADGSARESYKSRIQHLAEYAGEDGYHNMSDVTDEEFKENSTSYMRAAYLLDRVGVDVSGYVDEMREVKSRLDDHMETRGSHQQMVFGWYYDHFGWEPPFDLSTGYEKGIIRKHFPPWRLQSKWTVYQLTHEIFVPYRYGERLESDFFSRAERRYLRRVLPMLTTHWLMRGNQDIVAELVTCMALLGFQDLPQYREAIAWLLQTQNEDGSWGNYEEYADEYGTYLDHAYYLHTTGVVVDALTMAFELKPPERFDSQ